MNQICFNDFDDMEKQTRNLLLTEPDSPLREWIKAMLVAMDDIWQEGYERGCDDGYYGR